MSKKKQLLTAELIQEICTRLKAGSFEKVVVESLGLDWDEYQDWLKQAQSPRCRSLYRMLADAVKQARAHARFMAEMQVRDKDPKMWLLQGPGRQTATEDGWGKATHSAAAEEPGAARARLFELCAVLLEALTPFPEARAAAAEAVARFEGRLNEQETGGQQ